MNEKLKNLNKKQFEKCLITLEMLTFETPKIYTGQKMCKETHDSQKTLNQPGYAQVNKIYF